MKQLTRLIGIILLLSLNLNLLQSQEVQDEEMDLDIIVKEKMDMIFEHIDKSKIETGLLSDYGCLLVNPYSYNGILSDTNYVSMEIWKILYLCMYTTKINEKAALIEPQQVLDKLNQNSPALLFLQYNQLNEKALDNGQLILENGQLRETEHSSSLYLKKDLFAVGLPNVQYNSQVSFTFQKKNYISNLQDIPTQLFIRFTPESDYQNITWEQPISHTFTTYGEKVICIRAKYNNGKILESHALIQVTPELPKYTDGENQIDETIPIYSTNEHKGGRIQIKYAAFNSEKKKLFRPLIIADESDILKFFFDKKMDLEFLLKDASTHNIMESINKLYDIVYIDNNDSFDDIFHNAQLFEEAMERINGMRNSIHDKNYVIGIGMGGLVARYALKNMEQQGKVHDVCKYISINTPHKGANIPIGLQALVRYIQNLKIAKTFIKDIVKKVNVISDLLGEKAIKQMLVYSINKNYNYLNDHAVFMQKYEAMGIPIQCENIAISNGNYMGINLVTAGSLLFKLSNYPSRIFGFKSEIYFIKQKEKIQFYSAAIKALGINWRKQELNSTNEMLALDSAPGSIVSLNNVISDMGKDLEKAFKLSNFCFIPTVSALAINNWEDKLLSGLYLNSKDSGFDRLYATSNNNDYTMLETCSDFLSLELAPQIKGENTNIIGETTFTIYNVPDITPIPGYIGVEWELSNENFKITSKNGTNVTIYPTRLNESAQLTAHFLLNGKSIPLTSISITSGTLKIIGDGFISGEGNTYEVNLLPLGSTVTWNYAPGISVKSQNGKSIKITGCQISNPWLEATINAGGIKTTKRIDLKNEQLPESIQIEVDKMVWHRTELGEDWYLLRIKHNPCKESDETYKWKTTSLSSTGKAAKIYRSMNDLHIYRDSVFINRRDSMLDIDNLPHFGFRSIDTPIIPPGEWEYAAWYLHDYKLKHNEIFIVFDKESAKTDISCELQLSCKTLKANITLPVSEEVNCLKKLDLKQDFYIYKTAFEISYLIHADHDPCQGEENETFQWSTASLLPSGAVTFSHKVPGSTTPKANNSPATDPNYPIVKPWYYGSTIGHNDVVVTFKSIFKGYGDAKIKCTLKTDCGALSSDIVIPSPFPPKDFQIAPNPADGFITIKPNRELGVSMYSRAAILPISVVLYNNYGIVCKFDDVIPNPEIQINTTDIPDGNYYLNILQGEEIIEQQIIFIKHN